MNRSSANICKYCIKPNLAGRGEFTQGLTKHADDKHYHQLQKMDQALL